MLTQDSIAQWFMGLQDRICESLETEDGKAKFQEDSWQREGGGGGRTRVLQQGDLIEKGGVNFSAVHGTLPENIQNALGVHTGDFFATGVSIVLHPNSPMVPIIHMNVRYFELKDGTHWFGGGIDLTPHYVVPEQAKHFHKGLKAVCEKSNPDYYPKFKTWADDYFFIKHRDETRGIGGIFFDRLSATENLPKESIFDFVKGVGESFVPLYLHQARSGRDLPFGNAQKQWQMERRGRYVEFNLVYDKGTKFGLDTSGRIESILMSLPLQAGWPYDPQQEEGSAEKETRSLLKKGIDWAAL